MKILRVNHIGIVPKDVGTTRNFLANVLGLANDGAETVADQKVNVDFFRAENTRLELLEATDDASPIAKFLATRGAGIQHVALEVDNLDEWLAHLKKLQIKMIDETARTGALHTKVASVHPHATGGVLVELVEETKTK